MPKLRVGGAVLVALTLSAGAHAADFDWTKYGSAARVMWSPGRGRVSGGARAHLFHAETGALL